MGQVTRVGLCICAVLLSILLGQPRMMDNATGTPLLRTLRIYGTVVAADGSMDRAFVVSSVAGSVSVLDARSGNLLGTTHVGPSPQYITVDAPMGRVFVSSDKGESILDARSGSLLHTLPYRGNVAVAAGTSRLFMCSFMGAMAPSVLRVLDARSLRVLHTLPIAHGCDALTVAAQVGRVFVSNSGASTINLLDARNGVVLRTVPLSYRPGSLAVDERTGHVFVAGGNAVSMLDARTGAVLRTTPVNDGPADIAVDASTGRVFVTTRATIDVLDVRTGALVHSTNVDTAPASAPVVNASTGHVVVLLASPTDDRTGQINGPGVLLALDGSTGAVRQHLGTGSVLSFGLTDVVAADAHTKRLFVLIEDGVGVYDAARL